MEQHIHLLTKLGILKSFSVAKKVTEKEIKAFYAKHKKGGKTPKEIENLLKASIFSEIKDALETEKIPGLLNPIYPANSKKSSLKNIVHLNTFIDSVVNSIGKEKYDKISLCYFINTLVNLLGLTESDFEEFHKKMLEQQDENFSNEDDDSEDY